MSDAPRYPSETSKIRDQVIGYCQGNGLDIGHGGDPIKPTAITIDLPEGMANCGDHPTNIVGDARTLPWFRDDSLDYIYSSHTLEDMEDMNGPLYDWVRVLRPGGRLVLILPDQKRYEKHCRDHEMEPNPSHKHLDLCLALARQMVLLHGRLRIIHEFQENGGYSFGIVCEKTG